ncbi:MAG: YbeD family protein [Pseudomonadales bacterium]
MDEEPRIQFPCADYPIKVIGASSETLVSTVVAIVREHDEGFEEATVEERRSREGNYTSVRLSIRATGEPQLKALHEALMAHPLVKLVL